MAGMRRQNTAGQISNKTVRVPLAGNGQQRSTANDKDQQFLNYVFETTKNSVTDTKKLFVVKRPGTQEYLNTVGLTCDQPSTSTITYNNYGWNALSLNKPAYILGTTELYDGWPPVYDSTTGYLVYLHRWTTLRRYNPKTGTWAADITTAGNVWNITLGAPGKLWCWNNVDWYVYDIATGTLDATVATLANYSDFSGGWNAHNSNFVAPQTSGIVTSYLEGPAGTWTPTNHSTGGSYYWQSANITSNGYTVLYSDYDKRVVVLDSSYNVATSHAVAAITTVNGSLSWPHTSTYDSRRNKVYISVSTGNHIISVDCSVSPPTVTEITVTTAGTVGTWPCYHAQMDIVLFTGNTSLPTITLRSPTDLANIIDTFGGTTGYWDQLYIDGWCIEVNGWTDKVLHFGQTTNAWVDILTFGQTVTETITIPAPGCTESNGVSGRGLWYFNNAVWSVFGNTLYRNGLAKTTLSTATGMCGAVEFVNTEDYGKQGLFLADGIDAWVINSSDTVTRVDTRYLQWTAHTIVEEGDRRIPTTIGALWYVCTTPGTTGTTQPTWPTIIGNSVTDGTAVWRCEGTYSGPPKYTTGVKTVGMEVIPTTENAYWYKCTIAGTATAEPAWPTTLGQTVVDNNVTWECMGEYGGFPSPHIATPAFMDEYIFLPKSNSLDIYGSNITAPFSWSTLNFVGAESYPDPIVGLARQNNFIVAFGTQSTEFMYNYAKANQVTNFDSPLDRYESLVLQVGCLSPGAILQSERLLVFIGRSNLGGKAVWRLDGSNAKEISTEYIEKFLDLESSTSAITGFNVRIMGHMLFVINLPTSNKTFVYDIEENMWTEWQYNGERLPFVAMCDADGVILLQHRWNGKLYKFSPLVYNDFNADIKAQVRLAKQDFDTDQYKFFHQVTVVGDSSDHSYVLRWSDDDYQTWSNSKTLAPGTRPYFMRSGKARRRAWELEYTHNSPSRLEALEVEYSIGDH